jgi:hydrophobic/amphiphilic exporter-1 (mainly G- bacteria), HAE1 family
MRLVELSLNRRVTVSMLAVAVVLFGVVSFGRLPVSLLPDLSYPSLTVETRYEGAAPAEVETLVTRPVEEVVGVVTGVQRLTSTSSPGLSQVVLELGWGRDMDFAALDVRQKLDLLTLPRDSARPVLLRFDPANEPVLRLYLTGAEGLTALRYVAEEVVKKDLESTEGVAAIKVNGGAEEEIEVRVEEGKLARMGLSVEDVGRRLLDENVNQAGGSLYESEARYLVRAVNEFGDADDVLETVIATRDGRNVALGEVASVVRGTKRQEVLARHDGGEAVELAIYKEGDANTVTVARSIKARLAAIEGELPEGIEVHYGADQSRFIQASIDEVLANALIGGLIAMLVLLLFLKSLRSTLIIGLSIPISIVATFFLMYRTGTSLNVMSLGGLALGVGMLVDNAIVVLEAIFKRREAGASWFEASRRGAGEVGRAVAASTLTTVAVFVPVVFLDGIAAQLFRDMALTVSFSLLASLAVALTLIPMMTALAGRGEDAAPAAAPARAGGRFRRIARAVLVTAPGRTLAGLRWLLRQLGRGAAWLARPVSRGFDGALGLLARAYPRALRWSLAHRTAVLAAVVALFAGAVALVPGLGFDLIPAFSQGEFGFQVELPQGTPLPATDAYVQELARVLDGEPRIESYATLAGGKGFALTATGNEGENVARIQVRMAPDADAAAEAAVADLLRARLSEAAGVTRFELERPTVFTFRTPIEVEVYGDDLAALHEAAEMVRGRLDEIPGLVDVESSSALGNPELQVRFLRQPLARLGLDLAQVAATVRNKVQGEVATRLTEGDREIDVVVRALAPGQASLADVRDLIVGQRDGVPIYLKSVADIELADGPSEVRRIGQKRAAVVSGSLAGRDMGAVAADVRSALGELALPASVTAALSGQEEERARSLSGLLFAMGLAIFLVYLVMASQFESFLHPFVVIFTLPLGAIGVIGALALTGRSVDVVAMIGAVMLAGIVVNNAIVLIDAVNQRRRGGEGRTQALIAAGADRLRPILMTSATTILGLLPMALGIGEGAELRSPLAITVIGGLACATPLTLLVIPLVYTLFDRSEEPLPAVAPAESAAASEAMPEVAG